MKRHHRGGWEGHGPRRTVLVVDDDVAMLALCDRLLKGYRVLRAPSCAEALELYRREEVDLILSDVKMPGSSGIELLKAVKADNPNVPVVVMSGFSEQEMVLRALREGADDFIGKQFIQLQLQNSVERALCRKEQRAELADLMAMDCVKNNFLSIISHKLRTPITSISLVLQELQRNVDGADAESLRQALAEAGDEVSCLGRMVDELLLFSQTMEGGRLSREEVDLERLVAHSLRDSFEAQRKPGVETLFRPASLPPLRLDLRKISFAIRQVLDNAYKFSEEPGRVEVELSRKDGGVLIVVSDSGSGIPRDEQERVFDKFYQVDPEGTGQVRGLGLGLYYAREYVRQHGGMLTLESEPGRGTTVIIEIPPQ